MRPDLFDNVSAAEAKHDIEQFRDFKQPWTHEEMYVVPSGTKHELDDLKHAFREKQPPRSTFKVVVGKNGEGKSAMLKRIQGSAEEAGLAWVDFHFEDWASKKPTFRTGYVSEFLERFHVPGSDSKSRLLTEVYQADAADDLFGAMREKIYLTEDGQPYLNDEFLVWPDYAKAFGVFCDRNQTKAVRNIALQYMGGNKITTDEKNQLGVGTVDVLKSHHSPEQAVLDFYATLATEMKWPGLLVTYDEVEVLGTVGGEHGKWVLSFLRSVENFQFKRLSQLGKPTHLILAFSREYVIDSLQGRQYLKLGGARAGTIAYKTLLSDVPRLARIVEGQKLDTALNDEDALELLKRLKSYYGKAYGNGEPSNLDEKEFLINLKSASGEIIASNLLMTALGAIEAAA